MWKYPEMFVNPKLATNYDQGQGGLVLGCLCLSIYDLPDGVKIAGIQPDSIDTAWTSRQRAARRRVPNTESDPLIRRVNHHIMPAG